MAAYKWSMRIKYLSGSGAPGSLNRAASMTESVYWTSNSEGARTAFTRLAQARAGFLPNFCGVTGIRVQQVDPNGPGQLQRVFFPGQASPDFAQDDPRVSLLFAFPTDLTNVRKYSAAMLPDDFVKRGEPNLTAVDTALIRNFLLRLNGWLSRGEDLTKPKIAVKTIGADGTYELLSDLVMAPLSTVKVYNATKADGSTVSGQFIVASVTDSKHGVLRNWTAGACTLGSMRQIVIVYPVINTSGFDMNSITVGSRKVGAPSEKYVGRRRKGRRKPRTA